MCFRGGTGACAVRALRKAVQPRAEQWINRKFAAAVSPAGWLQEAPRSAAQRPVQNAARPGAPPRPSTAAMKLRVRLQKQTRRLEMPAAEPTLGQLRAHLNEALPGWGLR